MIAAALSWPGSAGLLWVTAPAWHVLDSAAARLLRAGAWLVAGAWRRRGVRVAGPDGSGDGAGWRVFVSHTSELRDFPPGNSYVAAVERAVSASGHVIVDMADFPAASQPAAQLCMDRVRGCDVYVGVLGTRYGSPVRDRPEVSYTELEFDTATEVGLDRLVFLLDENAADVGIPLVALIDREFGARQDAFRRRVQDSGLVTPSFASPAVLGQLVERSLRELATQRRTGRAIQGWQTPPVVVVGEIPQEPLGFQPRADLLAALDVPRAGVAGDGGARGDRDARGGQDAPGGGLCPGQAGGAVAAGGVDQRRGPGRGPGGPGRRRRRSGSGRRRGGAEAAGRAVRHWLEIDGDRCLLVFDNATDPAVLQPFIPAAGAARVIITSNQRSMANLGAGVPVDVFSEPEALAFLAERTGSADAEGARAVAAELGYLPLALGAGRGGDRRSAPGLWHLSGPAARHAGRRVAEAGGSGPVSARGGGGGAVVAGWCPGW